MSREGFSPDPGYIENRIFTATSDQAFHELALMEFHYQYQYNPVYRQYCDLLRIDPLRIEDVEHIPFLPIEMFKKHRILAGDRQWEKVFASSGTTGMEHSKHYVRKLALYRASFTKAFEWFYGDVSDYCILGFLPGYAENPHSSLIYMVDELIRLSGHSASGFYLNDQHTLSQKMRELEQQGQKTLLLGVSFALLDLAEQHRFNLRNILVMETGGMKGRREEITREELHRQLTQSFGLEKIHSEYGMAEMLSQAYSQGNGRFNAPPWMRVKIRDFYDPFHYHGTGKRGGINIIDLANIYSCPFLETKDIGKLHPAGSFEVLGRFDYSDIRGCNLLTEL